MIMGVIRSPIRSPSLFPEWTNTWWFFRAFFFQEIFFNVCFSKISHDFVCFFPRHKALLGPKFRDTDGHFNPHKAPTISWENSGRHWWGKRWGVPGHSVWIRLMDTGIPIPKTAEHNKVRSETLHFRYLKFLVKIYVPWSKVAFYWGCSTHPTFNNRNPYIYIYIMRLYLHPYYYLGWWGDHPLLY